MHEKEKKVRAGGGRRIHVCSVPAHSGALASDHWDTEVFFFSEKMERSSSLFSKISLNVSHLEYKSHSISPLLRLVWMAMPEYGRTPRCEWFVQKSIRLEKKKKNFSSLPPE